MLKRIAYFILKQRLPLIITIGLITIFMGYFATKIEQDYHFAKLLPDDDTTSIEYEFFKKKFGLDGTILVVGVESEKLKSLSNYNAWAKLGNDIKALNGIKTVVSIARINDLLLNDSLGKFEFIPLSGNQPKNQKELDAYLRNVKELPFYDGIVYNQKTNSSLMAITFNEKILNTKNRIDIVDDIKKQINSFNESTEVDTHSSGLPFIRTTVMRKIRNEMVFFLIAALVVTAILLFIFFRSAFPVVFSLIIIMVGVVTAMGTIVLFGYKLSVLSGLIPPLIIVIGVPNCILVLNKYHTEIALGKTQAKALHLAIQRASASLFFANITTSIGFAVFCTIQNRVLYEFGMVAAINVMATFIYSVVLVPAIFSYLSPPNAKHLRHLDGERLTLVLDKVAYITKYHRKSIYVTVTIISILSIVGLLKIKAFGYVVDDIPKTDILIQDLKYFENKFGGVLPFEILIDTKKDKGVFSDNARCLYKIHRAQKLISQYDEFSRPVSIAEGAKFLYQSYKGGEPKFYKLPSITELKTIAEYIKEEKEKKNQLSSFLDSSQRYTRISVQIADCGSTRVKEISENLKPRLDTVFNYNEDEKEWEAKENQYHVSLTGFCIVFLKGNEFLVNNLIQSVGLAIILIAAFMVTLFTSLRMIIIATIPSLVALIITAGLMGYLNIYLKPSTILVFSIAFGISSDGTLYFLTKYRHEIKKNKLSIGEAVRLTISETGISMVYTAIVLFFGFGMFALSGFGGTQALGLLISFTLIVAYCANLVLLPAFLLSLEKRLTDKKFINSEGIIVDTESMVEEKDDEQDTIS
ncbi:MAG: MMPL family transporter [Sphingobacteriaceae bacterium]|nr:MMPL family transporter [Sphingobacteriaceae bacterium]